MDYAPTSRPLHSKTKLKVWFAHDVPIFIPIQQGMKTSTSVSSNSIHPSLFQIAARMDLPRDSKSGRPDRWEAYAVVRLDVAKSHAQERKASLVTRLNPQSPNRMPAGG